MNAYSEVAVSILMVSYNTRELTLAAIRSVYESLVDQALGIEVIVVDNASSDGSAEAVRGMFPQAVVVPLEQNIGFGRGNNVAAEHASGQVLLLLNTDTVVRREAIETMYHEIIVQQEVGIVGPFLENPDGTYQRSMMSFPTVWRTFCFCFWLDKLFPHSALFADAYMAHVDPNVKRDVDIVMGTSMMIRRDIYRKLDGFDPRFFFNCEECDLCKRLQDIGYRSRYLPSARVMHYGSGSTRTSPWWVYRLLRRAWTLYARKHGGWLAWLMTSIIIHAAYVVRIPLYSAVGLFNPRLRRLGSAMLGSYLRRDVPVRAPQTGERQ